MKSQDLAQIQYANKKNQLTTSDLSLKLCGRNSTAMGEI